MLQPPSLSTFTKLSFSNLQCFPELSLTVQIDIQSLIHNLIDKVIRGRCLPGSYSLSDAVMNYILNSGNALAAGETRHFFYTEIAACIVPEPAIQTLLRLLTYTGIWSGGRLVDLAFSW